MSGELQWLKGEWLSGVSQGKWPENTRFPKGSSAYGGVHGQNRDTVTFHTRRGDFVFLADGDCCSQTFIESIEGPKAGLVIDVQEPEWGEPYRKESGDEVQQFYKVTLVIEGKGHLDVEYRNESNGYYGGSLELLSAPPLAGTEEKP